MVLSGGLPIFSFLPAVAIFPVLHLLAVVEDHRAILRPRRLVRRREGEGKGGQWTSIFLGERNQPKIFWTLVLIFQALVRTNRIMDPGLRLSNKMYI